MLDNRRLIIDTMSEVYDILKPYRDDEFWDITQHCIQPNSIYVLGRKQVVEQTELVRNMAQDPTITVVFGNSAEGSKTMLDQLRVMKLIDLVQQGKILLLSGGDIEPGYPYLLHEHFLVRILDYTENEAAIERGQEIFTKKNKPYRFLFLNGRARPHRKYLYERFRQSGLIDHALWTMLDGRGTGTRELSLQVDGVELLQTNSPITHLPPEYEFEFFKNNTIKNDYPHKFAKYELFDGLWGEIYLAPEPYIDTYFSLVTETVFEYPYSFRTEKIAKPLAMGHPFIVATSTGFYRDLHNLGFQTFGHLIDESFDQIDNHQDRMARIADTVEDLCGQDLDKFLAECYTVCRYNQNHLREIAPKIRAEFPGQFINFLKQYERS